MSSEFTRGYSGDAGPHKLPLLQLQLVAEFIFKHIEYEENNGCLIPNPPDSLYEMLDRSNIGLISSIN